MANRIGVLTFVAATLFGVMTASAITVATGGTGSTGAGGFTLLGSGTVVDVSHSAYSSEITTPASDWVWDTGAYSTVNTAVEFQYTFSMTGYDLATASLNGFWGVDNEGTAYLNGTLLSLLEYPEDGTDPFSVLHAYSAASALFVEGANTLTFILFDRGAPGAFRASVTVDASVGLPAAVPIPAALPLFGTGLALMGYLGWRRKRKAA